MTRSSQTFAAVALATTTLSLSGGCYGGPTAEDGDPAADQVGVMAHPQISQLFISEEALSVRPGRVRVVPGLGDARDDGEPIPGALLVGALPADPRYEFAAGARLPLAVRTNRGDAEELLLRGPGELCSNRPEVSCHKFLLELGSLDEALRLLPELESISARFTVIAIEDSSVTATVAVLDGDLEEAMRIAQRWPGVRAVKPEIVAHIANTDGGRHAFDGGLPVAVGAPVPEDGTLQFEVRDTITVEYLQPDGSVLATRVTP